MENRSCVGCKYLYLQAEGYSNWTWMDTTVNCALNKNKNLPDREPFDWDNKIDNWPATQDSRCNFFSRGVTVTLDVDVDDGPADYTDDQDAIIAISKHANRGRNGDYPTDV